MFINYSLAEDASDLLKLLKRTQDTSREQKELRQIRSEVHIYYTHILYLNILQLDNMKLLVLEKDMNISELQHQIDIQQLDTLKVLHHTPNTPTSSELSLHNKPYPLHVS